MIVPCNLQILIIDTDAGPMYRLYIGPYDNTSGIDRYLYFTKDQLEKLTDFLVNYLADK
jgi:hypothetical protein